MRISKIKIEKSETKKVNLKEIDLTKKPLGSTVALVGKNGAGKSRILKLVEKYANEITADKYYNDFITNIPTQIIGRQKKNVESLRIQFNQTTDTENIEKHPSFLGFSAFRENFKRFSTAYIKVVDNDDLKIIKDNISGKLTFEDIINIDFLDENRNVIINEFSLFNNLSTIEYFKRISTEIIGEEFNLYLKNKTNPSIIEESIKINKSFQLFQCFKKYVKQFLGKEFTYSQVTQGNVINSILHLNEEPFNIDLLSPGQKMLFAYAILFFFLETNSKANIRDCIIIIDEPEKHLHPEAQVKLIGALKNIISKSGQLWIATHSVHILSHLDFDEILMVKNDSIIPPSRTTPGNSFNELMGLEDHVMELTSFINSISEWAYGNFMVQCFKNPDVVFSNNTNDPQFILFKDFVQKNTTVELLDFGAGKGRIGYTISEDGDTAKKIIYSAYEPDKENEVLLLQVPTLNKLYYLDSEIPKDNYDIVVLCNVLHEINPNEWIELLLLIKSVLKENGMLIIIEDRFLPKGEKAHEFGYIILGTIETKILLNSNEVINLKIDNKDFENRIIFNAFKKSQINPTMKSLKSSIVKLMDNTMLNIKELRSDKNDVNQGRRMANETQLYINSKLYLDSLK
ncbi:AAA family ATPase [Epilithonimonas zeae]|uniref:AAA family ATPase n=1 Tax=Epilithonimonas zeae TaxID=1416779 RepID=UPI00200E091C|nr:AAA family ATPase [Epilithonimonas zeae]UQB69459.1 AAA family ATPase [Epilithonimonas zeae]